MDEKLKQMLNPFFGVQNRSEATPGVDFVRVVRCKECEYSYAEGFVNERILCEKHPELGNIFEDWFCADGWKA